jgi:hypothetical protein
MKKIPTIFERDMSKQPALVTRYWQPECFWVRDGEGVATVKWDGTCCLVRAGKLYKRRELRPGDVPPPDFESTGTDETTGKTVGWVPVGDGPEDRYHREAFDPDEHGTIVEFTYELVGPKVQGNKHAYDRHRLVPHGCKSVDEVPRTFDGLREWLAGWTAEGIVWHHPDGRMAKIKRRDFGFKW